MNLKQVLFILSNLLLAASVALSVPLAIAAYYNTTSSGEQDLMSFVKTIVITVIAGGLLH